MRNPMLLLVLGVAVLWTAVARAQTITTTRVASGLSFPVQIVAPPGDPSRLFIVELAGRIRVLKNGTLLSAPFLDLSAVTAFSSNSRGMFALTFHPQYQENGQLYVLYTKRSDGAPRVARYRRSSGNPDLADPSSGQNVITWPRGAANHAGGWLGFGPDGQFYISMGDGGGQGDPNNSAQNLNELWGKLLRLDVSRDDFPSDPEKNYAIPADNPYREKPGRPEIWALGLRNPWRCSFDRETGDLWIGDVGQMAREEVSVLKAKSPGGINFGWKIMEGNLCFSPASNCNRSGLVLPVRDYGRTDGRSITGGFVYRGAAIPTLRGTYFFADYETWKIWSFRWNGSSVTEARDRTEQLQPRTGGSIRKIVSFGEDLAGELYIVDMNGAVHKIVPVGAPAVPDAAAPDASGSNKDAGGETDAASADARPSGDAAGAPTGGPDGNAGLQVVDAARGAGTDPTASGSDRDARRATAPAPSEDTDEDPPSRGAPSGGCGCRVGGTDSGTLPLAVLLGLIGLGLRRIGTGMNHREAARRRGIRG
jgi:MYXO-CTERM domain-containing protein